MKYALALIALPVGLVVLIVSILVIAILFFVHSAFGYEEPLIDD